MLIIILKTVAILVLIFIAGLTGYVVFIFLPKLKETLSTVRKVMDVEVKSAVSDLNGTIVKINEEVIPRVNKSIENLNSTATLLQETIQTEVKPITENIHEATDKLSSDVAKLGQVVDTVVEFSQVTIKKAEFCREQLIIPVIEIASFWTGIKVGFSRFFDKFGGENNE